MEIILKIAHNIWYMVIPFIVLLGVLVFVHELGHFLVARLCGVRVEVFSLGFGKKLFQYRHGDTNYCISLVPLGGYVKMFGEQPGDSISPELKSVSFTHKHVLQRIAIVLAGPMMNFLFAILVFAFVAGLGEEKKPAIIGDLQVSTPAFEAGFRAGDKILTVAGQTIKTWDDLQTALNAQIGSDTIFEVVSPESESPKTLQALVTSAENSNPLAPSKVIGAIEGLQSFSRGTHVAVKKNSLLDTLGVKTGDKIVSVNNQSVNFWRDLEKITTAAPEEKSLSLVFRRVDSTTAQTEDLTVNVKTPASGDLSDLGIEPTDLYLAEVMKSSPAQKAGLMKGDRLVKISSKELMSWDDVLTTIKSYAPESGPLKIVALRNGELKNFEITPQMTTHMNHLGKEEKRFTIGIAPLISFATEASLTVKADGLGSALVRGVQKSYDYTIMTLLSFVRLVQGEISPKNVGGVISIGAAASESFKAGFTYFLQMMGIISISLFVLNLLPIPVLDGGHLFFYTIELFKGSPVSLRKMELAQQVGLVLLMSLMLFALYNDFSRLLGIY